MPVFVFVVVAVPRLFPGTRWCEKLLLRHEQNVLRLGAACTALDIAWQLVLHSECISTVGGGEVSPS